jgi:hypothetical protein
MKLPGFIGPTYSSRSQTADVQRCINLYPEIIESGTGQNKVTYYGTPGLATFCTLPNAAPIRGICGALTLVGGVWGFYVVCGTKLYFIKYDGSSITLVDTVANDASNSPVTFAVGQSEIMFASAGTPYLIRSNQLVAITGLTAATQIVFLNGYFLAIDGTNKFYLSALYDGSTWDPLDFASAEYMVDNIRALSADHNELWLFGDCTIEVWFNSGDATFPFQRIQEGVISTNTIASDSIQKVDNSIVWLGSTGNFSGGAVVWKAKGYTPQRISSHCVEQIWEAYGRSGVGGINTSWDYVSEGHHFYVLSFSGADVSWVWDAATGLWHERAYWTGSAYQPHMGRCHAEIAGKHIIGSRLNDGKLYDMSVAHLDDAGAAIRRARRAPHLRNDHKRMFYPGFELLCEVGVGNVTDVNPQIYLRWSNDGGVNFTSGYARSLGIAGASTTRVIWNQLGCAFDRVFEVYTTAKAKIAMIDAFLPDVSS